MKNLFVHFLGFILLSAAAISLMGSDADTSAVSYQEQIMQLNGCKLTTVTITGIDSAETESPSWPNGYFDATIFNNPDDSVTVSIDLSQAAGADSIRLVQLVGAFDASNLGAVIDTFPTFGTTLIQRRVVVTEALKYTYPFWGLQAIGFDGTVTTLTAHFMNYPKQQRVVVDTTL